MANNQGAGAPGPSIPTPDGSPMLQTLPVELFTRIFNELEAQDEELAQYACVNTRFQKAVEARTFAFQGHRPLRLSPVDIRDFAKVYTGNEQEGTNEYRQKLLDSIKFNIIIDDVFFAGCAIPPESSPDLFERVVAYIVRVAFAKVFSTLAHFAGTHGIAFEYTVRMSYTIPEELVRPWADDGLRIDDMHGVIDVEPIPQVPAIVIFKSSRASSLQLCPAALQTIFSVLPRVHTINLSVPIHSKDLFQRRSFAYIIVGLYMRRRLANLQLNLNQDKLPDFKDAVSEFLIFADCLTCPSNQLRDLRLANVADPTQFFVGLTYGTNTQRSPQWPNLESLVIEGFYNHSKQRELIRDNCRPTHLRRVFPRLRRLTIKMKPWPGTVADGVTDEVSLDLGLAPSNGTDASTPSNSIIWLRGLSSGDQHEPQV